MFLLTDGGHRCMLIVKVPVAGIRLRQYWQAICQESCCTVYTDAKRLCIDKLKKLLSTCQEGCLHWVTLWLNLIPHFLMAHQLDKLDWLKAYISDWVRPDFPASSYRYRWQPNTRLVTGWLAKRFLLWSPALVSIALRTVVICHQQVYDTLTCDISGTIHGGWHQSYPLVVQSDRQSYLFHGSGD